MRHGRRPAWLSTAASGAGVVSTAARQLVCDENAVLITGGAQQASFIAAKLVAGSGQPVLMVSPGFPRLKQALQLTASGLTGLVSKLSPANSGKFYHSNGPELPW